MTALAAAVMPIIRLLVAVATRSGTPIAEVHQRHLDDPAADPEERRDDARAGRPDHARAEVADPVALAGQPVERRRRRRSARRSPAASAASAGARRAPRREHRDRDVDQQAGEQRLEQPLVEQERDRCRRPARRSR